MWRTYLTLQKIRKKMYLEFYEKPYIDTFTPQRVFTNEFFCVLSLRNTCFSPVKETKLNI